MELTNHYEHRIRGKNTCELGANQVTQPWDTDLLVSFPPRVLVPSYSFPTPSSPFIFLHNLCCCFPPCADIEVKYHKKMQMMIQEEKKKRQVAVAELDERMKSREAALIEEHDRALRRVEEHFTSTQERLLTDQRTLKVRPVSRDGDFKAVTQEACGGWSTGTQIQGFYT